MGKLRDIKLGDLLSLGAVGASLVAIWGSFTAVLSGLDERITEVASSYHDTDMRVRDLRGRIASLESALSKAENEDTADSIRAMLTGLKAELNQLEGD